MHTAPNIQLRGRPLDRHWREARKRRTQSEDFGGLDIKPSSTINSSNSVSEGNDGEDLVESTLEQIRAKKSLDKTRISCEEIDCLLNNIRRSRSQSSTRPPPPSTIPPPPPSDPISNLTSLPFGTTDQKMKGPKKSKSKSKLNAKSTDFHKIGKSGRSCNNDEGSPSQSEDSIWKNNPLFEDHPPKPYPRRNSHADQMKTAGMVEDNGPQFTSMLDEINRVKETANRIKSEIDEIRPRKSKSPIKLTIPSKASERSFPGKTEKTPEITPKTTYNNGAVTIEEMGPMNEQFAQIHKVHSIRPPPRKNKASKSRASSRSSSSNGADARSRKLDSPPSKTSKQQLFKRYCQSHQGRKQLELTFCTTIDAVSITLLNHVVRVVLSGSNELNRFSAVR